MQEPQHFDVPLAMEVVTAEVGGRESRRLAVVLTAPGCSWARRTGGCRFCGFQELSTHGAPVSATQFAHQADAIVAAMGAAEGPIAEIDLYNSGSFLADDEVGEAGRIAIFERLATVAGLEKILIEARPEHVTRERLQPLVDLAPAGCIVEVGIGLESADDIIRMDRMRKGFTLGQFEQAAEVVGTCGAALLVYALIKPAGVTEQEARDDAVGTARYLGDLHQRWASDGNLSITLAYQPAFVAQGTELEREYLAGRYQLLSLWTVVEIVRVAAALLPVQVGLWDEGLSGGRVPSGCPECTGELRRALERFNGSGDVAALNGLTCACRTVE